MARAEGPDVIFIGMKRPQEYKGLLIKADLGLHDAVAKVLLEKLPAGARVLDLGAGEGALSARLSDIGFEVVAVDKDEQGFRCRQALFVRLDFDSRSEVERFTLSNKEAFDAVLSIEVIEHVEDQWNYVRNLLRMARPGGLIIVTTPNTTSWMSRLMFFFTGRFHQFQDQDLAYGHIAPLTPWELRTILQKAGAEDIQIGGAGTLPPLYISGINRLTLMNLLILPLRPFMSGQIDGWCVMAVARRPE